MTHTLTEDSVGTPTVLDEFTSRIAAGEAVTHVFSCAGRGEAVDVVLAVRDDRVQDFALVLDTLMLNDFGAILPGWHDLTARSGVLEVTYLVVARGLLRRWRLRLVATSAAAELTRRLRADLVYDNGSTVPPRSGSDPIAALRDERELFEPSVVDFLVETLVRLHVVHDHARDGRFLALHGELVHAFAALKNVVRTASGAPVAVTEWAGLDESLAVTVIARQCLTELRRMVAAKEPAGTLDVSSLVGDTLALVELVAPDVVHEFAGSLDSYRRYLGVWEAR